MGVERYRRKQRGVETRKRVRFVFVSAEGKNKTETNYLRGFGAKSVQLKFVSGGNTDPVKMSEDLIQRMDSDDFDPSLGDRAYCLVDGDVAPYKDKQIKEAEKLAAKRGFQIIFSNPCFEVWFLCHYCLSKKQFDKSADVVDELKKYLPQYVKSLSDMKNVLSGKLSTAVGNAKKLDKWNLELGRKKHTSEFQPCSEVYQLIEESFPDQIG